MPRALRKSDMPRNMSFAFTHGSVRNRTKRVTRRRGWRFLQPGDIVNACVKCMGLGKGGKVEVITQIRIVSNRREKLTEILLEGQAGCDLEGLPMIAPLTFVMGFCEKMGGQPSQEVSRIEFEYPPAGQREFAQRELAYDRA